MFLEHDVIYVSVSVRSPRCVNEVVQMINVDEDGVEGLGDSEYERATALLNGFEDIDVTIPVNEAPSLSGFMRASKKTKLEDDDVYVSDDLDSSDPDMSDDGKMPKIEKFRKEHFNKNYKFQWGMEFNSLDDFIEAIREWSVLNGREITFVKNESYRVRVECRVKCGFLILCSKVGHKHIYAIKTIVDKHTCARVLENISASSSWVAKAVVKKIQTSDNVRICDIIQDMRQNFSVEITVGRAWKAMLIAKRIIEGFINGCRPFVGVDGCHLKIKYGGQLLIAVGRDPNDQYFPLAFGVVVTETRDS
ncbi:uncharacterized protein LOC131640313 [Vicia villosa]|uniref:uncharacterized protein LOC131640313 n=1 Tax=Vicia villosa TaxID=3911 RepID=UPI00273CBD4F|nr:uncharacterized protein LOC131640313 [Vicia villosa]